MDAEAGTPTLSEVLRHRLRTEGSVRRVAMRSGVDRAVISRFRRGTRSIDLATADRLCRSLGLSLAAHVQS